MKNIVAYIKGGKKRPVHTGSAQLRREKAAQKLAKLSPDQKKQLLAKLQQRRLSWTQYLRLSIRYAILAYKAFVRKHRIATRMIAIFLLLVLLFSIWWEFFEPFKKAQPVQLSNAVSQLIGEPVTRYVPMLREEKGKGFVFNENFVPLAEGVGDSSGPKIKAVFSNAKNRSAVTVTDPINNVNMTIVPKFPVGSPKAVDNRVVYPINGKPAKTIYTLGAAGIKEDIILEEFVANEVSYTYDVELSEGTELRLENDGSAGVYGVTTQLLGNVSTATEKDAELLKKARQNGEKTTLLFRIPAPFVIESGKQNSKIRSWFSLEGSKLTIHAAGLKDASYPLSIDPSIYVESARKLMRGNNETNIDFDTTNELIQKSQTTGARIDYWTDTTPLSTGVWGQAMAAAGGHVYRAGGRVDPTMPYIVGQQVTNATTATTTFTMNMPSIRPAGDLYVALIARDGTGAITAPAGWTAIGTAGEAAAYFKEGTNVSGGNEAASYSWTIGTGVEWTGVMLRIRGFNVGSPISGTAGTGSSGTDAVPVYPSVTPLHDATLVLRIAGIDQDIPSEATWLPLGHTRIHSGSSSVTASAVGIAASYLDQPPLNNVATGTTSFVSDGILNDSYGAISVAIRPATVVSAVQNTVEWAQFNDNSSTIDSPNPGDGVCTEWCTNSVYNLPAARVGMAMFAYNGFLYATGGTTDVTTAAAASATNTVWIAKLGANGEPQLWHPTGGTPTYWHISTNTLPTARSYHQIYAYNNRLYLLGGRDTSSNSIVSVHVADLLPTGDIGSWTTTGMQDLTVPSARHEHSVHVYNDYLYIIGGVTSTGGGTTNTFRNTVFYTRLTTSGTMNAWQSTSSFATARSSFGGQMTTLAGGYVYLAGGCTALTNGYCSSVASDVQLASINSDGTLAPWNAILTLTNQKIGYTLMTWQGGLYRFGGCNRQNTTSGACFAVHRSNGFGVINPAGDASTVSNSEPSGTAPCSGGAPINCDLPAAGDAAGAATGGQMSSMVIINNGFIYNIGGCVTPTGSCTNMSGNSSYAALNSIGQMVAPANCPTGITSGLWCIDSTNQLNGTAGLGAAGVTVFNNTIYIAGGTDSVNWQANMWRMQLNADGSFAGPWQSQTFTGIGLPAGTADDARGYMYMFTRANPTSAGTNPGNLYMIGGCQATAGIGCSTYYTETIKCNIQVAGTIAGCTTTGQMQLDADNINTGSQGLGLMSGTVYANRVYLVGGACTPVTAFANTTDPCANRTAAPAITNNANRKETMFAQIDANNNIVDVDNGLASGSWNFTTALMNPVRRRAVAFGYNGYIYSLAGFSGTTSLQDLLFAKINVSTGDLASWDSSGVVVTPRWDLRAIVSNGYVYAIGGCGSGAAPNGCVSMQPEVQTFQLYNNDSGTPIGYSASANQFANDRVGGSSTILNGYLYVAGGCTSTDDCSAATNSVQFAALDAYGNVGTWTAGGNLPDVRAWGQLESIDTPTGGALYYIGGQSSTATDERTEVYYTTSIVAGNPTWSGTPASNGLPAARTQHGATVWDDRIYVTGGLDINGTASNTVYISPRLTGGGNITSAWTTSTNFNVARSGLATVAYANNLYIMGGHDGTNYLSDVQFASIGYKVGTISQSGNTITGAGTTWTTAMIGSSFQYRDGEVATILTVPSATSMTVSVSKTVIAGTGYTILDGSINGWSYTTSLPEPIRQGDAFASNGYMYLVGGRSSDGDCVPNTLMAPVSANTTIATGNNATGLGEWYETNVRYNTDRYGNSVAYANGKMYITGGACEKWPTVSSVNTQVFNTDTTSHNVTMPAVVDPGDLLLVLFSNDGNATVTTPAGGWTLISTQTRGANVRGSVYALDAVGTEDGTNVDFVTSVAEQASVQVYRIPAANWHGTIATGVEAANVDPGGTTNAPDPPLLNPTNWNIENTLWINYVAGSQYASVTTYPTSTTNPLHVTSTGGAAGDRASTSSSRRELRAASEDPAAYAMPSTSDGTSFTIAIRPSAFAYTGANRTIQTAVYSQPQVASYSRLIDTDTDVFPTSWLMNGLDNSIGARWRARYRSMHDIAPPSDTVQGVLQQNPNEDCGTSSTMSLMSTWGEETNYGDVTLGDVATYRPRNGAATTAGTITQTGVTVTGSGTSFTSDLTGGTITYADGTTALIITVNSATSLTVDTSKTIAVAQTYRAAGGNINCARFFYFFVSIDASQTFGYPEDVNRGPTISDLTLYFTSDPSKRLRHGKTFTGGEQQPLDTPCRQSIDPQCSLP